MSERTRAFLIYTAAATFAAFLIVNLWWGLAGHMRPGPTAERLEDGRV